MDDEKQAAQVTLPYNSTTASAVIRQNDELKNTITRKSLPQS